MNTTNNNRPDDNSGLILPTNQPMSRRGALRLGAFGIGGLALGGLASACSSDSGSSSNTTGGSTAGSTATGGSTAATGAAKDSIKAHWVYIGPADDNGWTQEHDRARQAAVSALGDKLEAGFTPNIGFEASTTQLFEQLAEDGNDIIFANTEYAQLMSEVASRYPDTKFVECDGHLYTDNLFPFYLAHEPTAYQMGAAAALLTDNGRIGYIGAFPTATTYNDVNGLLLGARSVNPEATVETVLVSTFFDPQKAAQAADALLSNGVEFLFGVMDEPTFLQLAEEAGVWTGYWNLDFRQAAPTKYVSNFDLTALGPFYTEQCQAVLDGTWSAPSEVVLLDTPLGAWGDNVPEDVQTKVAEISSKLSSGELTVYTGPLNNTEGTEVLAAGETIDSVAAYSIDFAVEGVSGI